MSKYLLKNERMHTSCALPDLWFQEIPFWSRIPPPPPAPNLLYLSTEWSQICPKRKVAKTSKKSWEISANNDFFSLNWIIYTKFQHSKKICARNFDFEKRISGGNLVLVPSTTLVRNRVRSSWSNLTIVWMRGKVSYQVLRRRYSQIYAPT